MFIVGLTGGIGSGKTSVSKEFEKLGIHITDTDMIAREVVMPGSPCLTKIAEHFGPKILTESNELNRQKLREIIFNSAEEKSWLEALLHPVIREQTRHSLSQGNSPYVILSSPLLLESPDAKLVNRVLVVDVPEQIQEERTAKRDNNTQEQVKKIIAAQMPREQRLALANDIIDNSSDLGNTLQQVARLHEQYKALAQEYE